MTAKGRRSLATLGMTDERLGRQVRSTATRRGYAHANARAAGHHRLRRGARARVAGRGRSRGCASAARSCCARSSRRSPAAAGRPVAGVRRLGKRIVLALDGELFLVLHLMIAGRLRWKPGPAPRLPGKARPRGLRLRRRHARAHRGRARRSARRCTSSAARRRSRPLDRGGLEVLDADLAVVPRRAAAREPHAQARAHRPAALQRHRQRLLRRDPPPRAALAGRADAEAHGRGDRAPLRGRRRRRSSSGPSGCGARPASGFPEKVTAFRDGDGRARPLRPAVPGLRRAGAAHRLRRERDELLRRAARPAAGCSPTARCRACSRTTGRAPSTSSSSSRAGTAFDPAAPGNLTSRLSSLQARTTSEATPTRLERVLMRRGRAEAGRVARRGLDGWQPELREGEWRLARALACGGAVLPHCFGPAGLAMTGRIGWGQGWELGA